MASKGATMSTVKEKPRTGAGKGSIIRACTFFKSTTTGQGERRGRDIFLTPSGKRLRKEFTYDIIVWKYGRSRIFEFYHQTNFFSPPADVGAGKYITSLIFFIIIYCTINDWLTQLMVEKWRMIYLEYKRIIDMDLMNNIKLNFFINEK